MEVGAAVMMMATSSTGIEPSSPLDEESGLEPMQPSALLEFVGLSHDLDLR